MQVFDVMELYDRHGNITVLKHIQKIGFFLPGNWDFMIGFQNHVTIGFKKLLYFVEIDDIGIVDSKETVFW